MARRPLFVALALVALGGGACRSDTIRTTSGTVDTVADPGTPTTAKGAGGGSTTAKGAATTVKGGTPTTRVAGGSAVVLGGATLGSTGFGAGADDAIAAVRKELGAPTRDQRDPGAACPGPDRLVQWGRFSIYMSDGKLSGWAYESTPAGPPQLATPSGITVGSTVATVRRVYGDKVAFTEADETLPASFRVTVGSTELFGTLTGTADTATTTGLYAGLGCGE